MQQAFSLIYSVLYWLLLFRMFLSFIPTSHNSPVNFVYTLTEPLLAPIRNAFGLIHFGSMSLDISPLVLLLLLDIVRKLLTFVF